MASQVVGQSIQSSDPSIETMMSWPTAYGSERLSQETAWFTLLQAMEYSNLLRLAYCYVFKRWLDVVGATVILVVLLPVLALVALAIRFESAGPVIFRQRRIGKYGKPFVIYKFRTMRPNKGLVYFNQDKGKRASHKVANDPRITRLGSFLRKTSVDELPQLFNILRGDMSFVGPRPEMIEIVEHYRPWQHQRHLVVPGLTGWWQVEGRGKQPMCEFTELDLYYVQNQSFVFDMKILLRTARVVLARTGAF